MTQELSQPNNATLDLGAERRFGIRITAPPDEFFSKLVGENWETYHWFVTRAERDQALRDMASRHRYSRIGDLPTTILEPVER